MLRDRRAAAGRRTCTRSCGRGTWSLHGPRNHFRLEPSPAYLFIAGGIGITPILPMIGRVEARCAGRLAYGGRTARRWRSRRGAPRVDRVTLQPQDARELLDLAAGSSGRADTRVRLLPPPGRCYRPDRG